MIIGLGNPEPKYDSTYHNVGTLAVNYLIKAAENSMSLAKKSEQKEFAFFKFLFDLPDKETGQEIIFVKPKVFMNESGVAAAASVKYFKIKPEDILVIHDDSDIELGKIKISFGRGAGGHHGIESIIKNLKTKNFYRLRIGIREKKDKEKAEDMVLKKITQPDRVILENIFKGLAI